MLPHGRRGRPGHLYQRGRRAALHSYHIGTKRGGFSFFHVVTSPNSASLSPLERPRHASLSLSSHPMEPHLSWGYVLLSAQMATLPRGSLQTGHKMVVCAPPRGSGRRSFPVSCSGPVGSLPLPRVSLSPSFWWNMCSQSPRSCMDFRAGRQKLSDLLEKTAQPVTPARCRALTSASTETVLSGTEPVSMA